MAPDTAALSASDLTHDILRGVLNGVTFDEYDDLDDIAPIACEVCGTPVYLGIIASTCGDIERSVWQDDPAIDGYSHHKCGRALVPDKADCPVCFDEDEDDEAFETVGALSAV